MHLEIRVLGPVQVWARGSQIVIDGHRSKALLAGLVSETGVVLSTQTLTDYGWTGDIPRTIRRQVRNRVTALRRTLIDFGYPADIITSEGAGFVLHPGPAVVDLAEFTKLTVAGAREASSDARAAVELLRAGLDQWRGLAFEGLDTPRLLSMAAYLAEKRFAAWEQCLAIELRLGRHQSLISELTYLLSSYPTHERFALQLMLALHRSGRRSDALTVYKTTRRRLVDELGVDPGIELRTLQDRILQDDPSLFIDSNGLFALERGGLVMPLPAVG